MGNAEHSSQFARDLVHLGPFYAVVHDRILAPEPLEAKANWAFWTEPRPDFFTWFFRSYPPESKRKKYLQHMMEQSHVHGIKAHYDVSNGFYALFLDKKYQFYTCADFHDAKDSLEEAQIHKAQYLKKLLCLEGKEKVLDLGCGWGAMLRFLREGGHGGALVGYTLSQEQLTYIQEVLGYQASLTDFITEPFTGAPYDRVLSIGSLEHVRPKELAGVYSKMYDALAPGGLAVHQFFSLDREPYPASMVMVQLFFPGSLLALHEVHLAAAKKAGFAITHDSVHDYKPTLRAWYERLAANQDEALELVGVETFNRYMTFFPVAWLFFQKGEARLHRLVLQKS